MNKRIISALLVLVMALGLVVPAMAAEDGAAYSIPMDTDSLTSYDSRYSVRIYSSIPMAERKVGDVIELRCELLDARGEPTEWSNPSIVVGNDDIVSLSAYSEFLDIKDGFSFKVKGTAEGQTDITVTDSKSGAYATVTLTFGSDPIYRIDQVPDGTVDELWAAGPTQTNFYDVNGLYVNGFSQSYDKKTDKYNVSFSVFNSTYMNGAVDIYNAEGKWIASKKINKVTGAHSIKDTFEDGWDLSADLFAGKGLSYTLSSSTEETPIKFEVPKGGYFTISNNFANSPGTYLYNMIDFIVLSASSITDAAIGVITDTTKITNLTSVMEDKLFDLSDVTDDLVGEMRSYATKALTSAGEYNMSQFAEVSVCSFEEFLNAYNIDLDKIVGAELGIAESVFKRLTGPIGNVLSLLFTGSKYGDYLTQTISLSASGNNPIIKIFATEESYMEEARSISDTAEMDRAVFQVFQVAFEKIVLGTNEQKWQNDTYRIRLIPREKETDSEVVSVMLPRSSWFNGKTCVVQRVDIFGNTELESEVGTSFISFKTDYSSGIIPDGSKKESEKVLLEVNSYNGNGELVEAIHFDYDEDGLISRSYHDSYWNGSPMGEGYIYTYTYDDAGRLLSRNYYIPTWGGGFDDVVRSYDGKGQLVSDSMYGEGEVSEEKEYAYGEDGQLIWERATYGSPFLGGKVTHEYSYSYSTNEQGDLVGVRHDATDPGAADEEFIYDAEGRITQGCDEDTFGDKINYTHTYIDDPYFLVEDSFETFVSPTGEPETRNMRSAYILDNAGQELESFMLGSPEEAQMHYDENGYLVSVDNIENTYYIRCEFIYGAPGEEPETSNTDTEQQLPPLSYEERTEHYDHVISGGVLTGTSDLTYPYFTDDSPIATMLNESIGGVMDERRVTDVETDEETEEFFKEVADQGLPPGLNDVEVTVTYNGSDLVSLLYRYSDYGSGAAHVYTRYEGHTYDIGTCEELDYRDLAGIKYGQMNACYTREAAAKGVSSSLDQAEAYVLSADGLNVYCNMGYAVPREIITVPFTSEYFDRAPASGTSEGSDESASGSIASFENNDSDQPAASRVTLTVTGNAVNIRSGPGTNYASLGKVNKGDKLFSTGKSDNWYQVEYGDGTGYIIEDYVTIDTGGIYTATDSGTLSVNGIDVNIRSGPGTEYQSIGKVSRGTTLTITGKSDNWYQVSYSGGTGYIIEDYVIKNG